MRAAPHFLTSIILATCLATTPARAADDPLEAVNRPIHAFNLLAQRNVLAPVAAAYRGWTPAPVRAGLANLLANLAEPVTAASALLSGDTDLATTAALRFGLNTTLGLGGVHDVAAERGHPRRTLALGDALCRWGVPSGPYLVLPLLGPSSLRDAGATVAASLALSQAVGGDAVLALGAGTGFVDYVAAQPDLTAIDARALDSYATLRSLWRQRRAATCPADIAALAEAEE